MESAQAPRQYQWIPNNKDNTSWSIVFWPFHLRIDYRPREPLPYVGVLEGKGYLVDGLAWATSEEATKGMVEWALRELSFAYHEMSRLLNGGAG